MNQESNNSNSPVVVGYSDPEVEGTSITINCLPGLVLVGPSTLVCMGNGEWEPDPIEVACTEKTTSTAAGMYNHIIIIPSRSVCQMC